jgi:hypothetical protein
MNPSVVSTADTISAIAAIPDLQPILVAEPMMIVIGM